MFEAIGRGLWFEETCLRMDFDGWKFRDRMKACLAFERWGNDVTWLLMRYMAHMHTTREYSEYRDMWE
jgi:hypothetical protein